MTANAILTLSLHVQSFFGDYLTAQRAMSPNTVLSYRDTFKLFLSFAARHHRKDVTALRFEDIGPDTVLEFLDHVEKSRNCSVRTRNARLAALHTFFRYVSEREPGVLDICHRISAIPVKKTQIRSPVYLEHDEVLHILRSIDRSTALGRRDHLLVHMLFETGARAQEIASLRTSALRLTKPHQVRILGKGRKERICPLRAKTATLIRQFLRERGVSEHDDVPIFVGPRRDGLSRYGVLRAVQRRVRQAATSMPTLASKQSSSARMPGGSSRRCRGGSSARSSSLMRRGRLDVPVNDPLRVANRNGCGLRSTDRAVRDRSMLAGRPSTTSTLSSSLTTTSRGRPTPRPSLAISSTSRAR